MRGPKGAEAWIGWPIAAGALLFILAVTLIPAGQAHTISQNPFCIICGQAGLANILRNVLLFVPLGTGLSLLIRNPILAWIPTLALTVGIETAQLWIPGRNALLIDVAANAAGGAVGIAFIHALRDSATGSGNSKLVLFWRALPFSVIVLTAWALQLAPPEPPHIMQLQPRLAHLAVYEGRVERAELGERQIRLARIPDPELLERQLFEGDTLVVDVTVEPRRWRTASLVSFYTHERRELFLLGVAADDVVLHLPFRAAALRLTVPDLRLSGSLGALEEGSRAQIRYWASAEGLARAGACLSLNGIASESEPVTEVYFSKACHLRPTLGDGWALLYFVAGLPGEAQRWIRFFWLLLLTLPAGLMARRWRWALGLASGAGATAWAAPILLGSLAVTPLAQVGVIGLGVGLGHLVRRSWLAWVPPRESAPLR